MSPLQPGVPSPTAIPWDYHLIIIDLQKAFFTVPLLPRDCQRFSFSVPSINQQAPMQRYCWRVLPQGTDNSPALCQKSLA